MFRKNESMSLHTTFRVGGPADLFAEPESMESFVELVRTCLAEHTPYSVIGNGSNLLVGDRGYRGMIIALGKGLSKSKVTGNVMEAQAGTLLSAAANTAAKNSLRGMEFASGIPGSLGGAIVMNAGAYGSEMKDVLSEIRILEADGSLSVVTPEELELDYRSSNIPALNRTVLSAKLVLQDGDEEEILSEMKELNTRRKEKQPLEYPSAGSTFKRPAGFFAGKLIQDAGLSGLRIGGAKVSEKHCGFIINAGNATAADIRDLIWEVQKRVKDNSGVELETEVRMIGEF